jgi:hypothetical protein
MRALAWVIIAACLLVRVPSLVEPAGADQDLYAYVGQTILRGGLPYVDAWDQKPPAIHYTYAAMYALWPSPAVVAATDLLVAAMVALALVAIGRRLGPPGAGHAAAIAFLLLGNPAFTRLGGIRVRSQGETFIALAVALAVLAAIRWRQDAPARGRSGQHGPPAWFWLALAGALVGVAAAFKYNALVYGLPVLAAAAWSADGPWRPGTRAPRPGTVAVVVAGALAPLALTAAWFAAHGALGELHLATVLYNLEYSGETYDGPLAFVRYLLAFPVGHARIDGLWFVGGLGTAVSLVAAVRDRRHALAPVWVATACLSIAINGSRGLPQYFVQAHPALALAAGMAGAWAWPRLGRPLVRVAVALAIAWAVGRVASFGKVVDYARHDLAYWRSAMPGTEHLARFGARDSGDKFSALAVRELATYVSNHTQTTDRVLVFGFSPGALLQAGRSSASRFFWSRPVIVGFEEGRPGFGASGLLDECRRVRPSLVVLQRRDWDPDTVDSATFFMSQAALKTWLEANHVPAGELGNYLLWKRTR